MSKLGNTFAAAVTAAAIGTGVYWATTDSEPETAISSVIEGVKIEGVGIAGVGIAGETISGASISGETVKGETVAISPIAGAFPVGIVRPVEPVRPEAVELPAAPEIQTVAITGEKIAPAALDDAKLDGFLAERRKFRDLRNLTHDASTLAPGGVFERWMKIFREWEDFQMEFVPFRDASLRMAAEVRFPKDDEARQTLFANLSFYAKKGYNGCLLVFGIDDLDEYKLSELVYQIRSTHPAWRIFFTFGAGESLRDSVYPEPDKLGKCLTRMGELCDGFLLAWRRTSAHLFLADKGYQAYLTQCVREGNPKIPVFGEVYYGETAESAGGTVLTSCVPENASGAVITGLGYSNLAVESIVRKVRSKIGDTGGILTVILGERAYARTSFECKRRLEKRWRRAGCATITLNGNGDVSLDDMTRNKQKEE
ncbi:MAG: hypothetical protein PHS41_10010 [Victivallaceae bacterium]|nr:hypothetical protein [Victivallaceae bacterium]